MSNKQEKIDKYLRKKMTQTERQAFENTMETDKELTESVALNKDIMQFFEERNPNLEKSLADLGNKFFNETQPTILSNIDDKPNGRYHKIIIGVSLLLIFFALGFYLYSINQNKTQHDLDHIDVEKAINEGMLDEGGTEGILTEPIQEKMEQETPSHDSSTDDDKKKNPPIAGTVDSKNFTTNAVSENLIRETVRSTDETTQITFPKIGYTFKSQNGIINFKIKGQVTKNQSVDIFIYNNTVESFTNDNPILSTSKTFDDELFSYNVNIELQPGLYYYILKDQTTNSIIHISKFIVKQ